MWHAEEENINQSNIKKVENYYDLPVNWPIWVESNSEKIT